MKKLLCLLLVLLCLAALATTAFADLIIPPQEWTGENFEHTEDTVPLAIPDYEPDAAPAATEAPAGPVSGGGGYLFLYLGIGAAAVAAALALFFLLRKKVK